MLLSLTPSKIKRSGISYFDCLTEDEAVAFECYRGSPLNIFAGDVSFLEEHIKTLTVEGIEDYFRYKTDYLGMQRTESNV